MPLRRHNQELFPMISDLYFEKFLSVPAIAKQLDMSQWRIYHILQRSGTQIRTPTESNSIVFKNKEPSFAVRTSLTPEQEKLKLTGILLYWCEGSKWEGESKVDFANSDAQMIRIFTLFLKEICGVDAKRLRGHLYCYANQDPDYLQRFWSGVTGIPLLQFQKPYVRQDFRADKIGKMPYGVMHVCYGDKKLLQLLREWIDECRIFRAGSLVGSEVWL